MQRRDRDESTRKRALRDILAYEDTITVDVEKTVQKIRDRAKHLHNELDRYINSMLTQLKHKFEHEMQRIRYAIDKLKGNNKQKRSNSLDRTPRYRSTPRSTNSSVIDFNLNSSISTQLNDIDKIEQFEKKELRFYDGEINDTLFQKLVGYYTWDDTPTPITFTAIQRSIQAHRRSEVKLVKQFKCGDVTETVHAIATVDDMAWVCCGWGSRSLHLYDKHGLKQKSTTLDIQINDATTFHDGENDVVLISSYREKSIKRLLPDNLRGTSDFAYISLFPGGLCSDRKNGIYVCFRDSYQRIVTFGARRMVAKLSKHGEIVATMEKDEEQKNLFGYPFRIAVNVNGDVCVSDYGDGTKGVTILHKDGRVKSLYRGPPAGMAQDQPFLPHGIVCDDNGHILVSDWNNDCVHVLDSDGNFLLNLVDNKDGIEGPNALGLDRRGYLWVGDSHGIVRIFKYHIDDD